MTFEIIIDQVKQPQMIAADSATEACSKAKAIFPGRHLLSIREVEIVPMSIETYLKGE